jgi:hypothetical protein
MEMLLPLEIRHLSSGDRRMWCASQVRRSCCLAVLAVDELANRPGGMVRRVRKQKTARAPEIADGPMPRIGGEY